ncbi:hypothetical protein ACFOD9_01920 [Novosphingobium bradum]|uniref:Uncharacterized protein n=1 Tax=Novosphingobium bradum TaxID=1737444 RepID=A0ABV7ILY9_9SPHN
MKHTLAAFMSALSVLIGLFVALMYLVSLPTFRPFDWFGAAPYIIGSVVLAVGAQELRRR